MISSASSSTTALGVFAKFWEPGRVKTRLAAELGETAAAEVARACLQTTLQRLGGLAERREVCFTPADRFAEFRDAVPSGWTLAPQVEGDLGRRMEAFFDRTLANGTERVVLVGADTPSLPRAYVGEAFETLIHARVVLGPAADGGYYLVGVRMKTPPIFRAIDWSTPAVWRQTIAALHQDGLREHEGYAVLPEWNDIDTLEDLRQLGNELALRSEPDDPLTCLSAAIDRALGKG